MPFEGWGLLAELGAVGLTALALQLMDDAVDRRRDRVLGAVNWRGTLGDAATPYAMLLLVTAVLLSVEVASALFLAAYALGMAGDGGDRLPTGLRGWHESLVASGGCLAAWGWSTALWAHALILSLQLTDDLLDAPLDRRAGELRQLLRGADRVQKVGIAAVALLVAVRLQPGLSLAAWMLGLGLCWLRRPAVDERRQRGE